MFSPLASLSGGPPAEHHELVFFFTKACPALAPPRTTNKTHATHNQKMDYQRQFLQRVRDSGSQRCPEVTERNETCVLEESDGLKIWRCTETVRRLRACLDG